MIRNGNVAKFKLKERNDTMAINFTYIFNEKKILEEDLYVTADANFCSWSPSVQCWKVHSGEKC